MNRENTLKAVSCLCFSLSVITTTQVIMKLNTLSIPLMIASRGIFIVVANYVHRIIIERKSIKFYPNKYYLSLNLLGSLSMSLSNQLGFFSVRLIPMGVANIIF